jgi:hypothetical protein
MTFQTLLATLRTKVATGRLRRLLSGLPKDPPDPFDPEPTEDMADLHGVHERAVRKMVRFLEQGATLDVALCDTLMQCRAGFSDNRDDDDAHLYPVLLRRLTPPLQTKVATHLFALSRAGYLADSRALVVLADHGARPLPLWLQMWRKHDARPNDPYLPPGTLFQWDAVSTLSAFLMGATPAHIEQVFSMEAPTPDALDLVRLLLDSTVDAWPAHGQDAAWTANRQAAMACLERGNLERAVPASTAKTGNRTRL